MKTSTNNTQWQPWGRFENKEMWEAFLHVIGGGNGLPEDDLRLWAECQRSLSRVARALRRGELRMGDFGVQRTPKRSLVILNQLDAIVARAVAVRARKAFDHGFGPSRRPAQLYGNVGQLAAVKAFLRGLKQAHRTREVVEVISYDVMRCYPSLSASRAIESFEQLTGATGLARSLDSLYTHVAEGAPNLSGLFEGMAPSAVLQDIALLPLDDAIALIAEILLRYADDSCAIVREGIRVDEAWTVVDDAERIFAEIGEEIRLHHRVHASVHRDRGFLEPLDCLGVRFEGTERYVAAKKLDELREEVRRGEKKASDIRRSYRSVLTEPGREGLERALSSVRTSGRLDVTRAVSPYTDAARSQVPTTAKGRSAKATPAPSDGVGGRHGAPCPPRRGRVAAIRQLRNLLHEQGLLENPDAIQTHRGEEFKPFSTNLSLDGGDGSQHGIVQAALERAAQLADTPSARRPHRVAQHLTLICLDFLATNSFGTATDPAALGRFLAQLERLLRLRLVAWRDGDVLYVNKEIAGDLEGSGSDGNPMNRGIEAETQDAIERVAYHEAGHAIAAIWHEIELDCVTIAPEGGTLGYVEHRFDGLLRLDADRDKLEAQALIALAGAACEAHHFGRGRTVDWYADDFRHDLVQASGVLQSLSAHEDEGAAYFDWIKERAMSLVAMPRFVEAADALAEALIEHRELTGEQASKLAYATWKSMRSKLGPTF